MTTPTPLGSRASSARPAPWRSGRGIAAGLVCGAGAVVAHTLAGGQVGAAAGAYLTVVGVALCLALAHGVLTLPRLLVAAGTVQAVAHLALAGAATDGGSHAGHLSGAAPTEVGASLLMLASHLVVAVATALLAWGADRALLDLARQWLGRLLTRLVRAAAPLPSRRAAHVTDPRLLPVPGRGATPASTRGPPARSLVLITLP